jgi:hypothetical protein
MLLFVIGARQAARDGDFDRLGDLLRAVKGIAGAAEGETS